LYPNPASQLANVPVYLPKSGQVHVAVYNLAGQKVVDFSEHYFEGRADVPIGLAGLRDGTYVVKIHIEGTEHTRKLVVKSNR
jgi:hypothetical protein